MNKLKDLERETGIQKQKEKDINGSKMKKKRSIWDNIKVNKRKPTLEKRGGFEKGAMVAGSKIRTPKRRSKESKDINFDKDN